MRNVRGILAIAATLVLAAGAILCMTRGGRPTPPPDKPATPKTTLAAAGDAPKIAPVLADAAKQPAKAPVAAELQPGSIRGTCRDKDSGEGVEGVPVAAYWWKSRRGGNGMTYGLSKAAEASSGADGRFELSGLMPGPYLLDRGEAQDYCACSPEERIRVEVHPGERLEGLVIDLIRGVPVSGRVVDERRAPIEGAEVHLRQRNEDARVAFTDKEGAFHFTGAITGQLAVLEAAAPGFMAVRSGRNADGRSQTVPQDGLSGIELVLSPGRSFEGILVDEAGQPIADASINAHPTFWGAEAKTKADGSFQLLGYMADAEEVTLQGRIGPRMLEFLDGTEHVHLGPQPHTKGVRAVARLQPEGKHLEEYYKRNSNPEPQMTTGRLVDEAGNPVNDVEVSAGSGISDSGQFPPFTVSGPDGRFAIDFGSVEQATLIVRGEDIVNDTFEGIRAGSKDNVLTVRRSLPVNGIVRDAATGEPVKRFRVTVLRPGEGWSPGIRGRGPMDASEELWAPDGRFTVRTRTPDAVTVGVVAPGYGPVQQDVALEQNGHMDPVEFLLKPELAAAGVVVDSAGRPIGGARVVATAWDNGQRVGSANATTDPDGRFALGGLEAKAYTLLVMLRDFAHTEAPLDLTRQAKAEVRIVLERTGVIEGRVMRDGVPVPEESVEVKCLDEASVQVYGPGFSRTEFTDSEGHYRVNDVPAGNYEIYCDVFDTRVTANREKREARVEPGMTTEVNFP